MKRQDYNQQNELTALISEYEAMSQKGMVGVYEETVFRDFAKHYQNEHKFDQALQVLEHGLKQYKYSSQLYFFKAQLLVLTNQHQLALKAINQAMVCSPSDEKIHRFRYQLQLAIAELEKEEKFEDIDTEVENTDFGILLNNTFISKSTIDEQFADIDELYRRLKIKLSHTPHDNLSLNKLLVCIEINEQYADGLDFLLQFISDNPYVYTAWFNVGKIYTWLNQYDNAADAFEYAFIINDTFLPAYKDFAEVCFAINDYNRVLNAFEDLLKKTEPDSDILTMIGECYEMREDYSVAYLFYTKAIKIDAECSEAHFRLGECFAQQKQWKKAVNAYQTAIAICDDKANYFAAIAEAYYHIDNYYEAFLHYEKAADLTLEIPAYWMQLILFLMETEQYELAWEKLEEAETHIIENSAQIAYAKVACLFLDKQKQAARKLLIEVLMEHYAKHELLFEYAPELEGNHGLIAMINICNQN